MLDQSFFDRIHQAFRDQLLNDDEFITLINNYDKNSVEKIVYTLFESFKKQIDINISEQKEDFKKALIASYDYQIVNDILEQKTKIYEVLKQSAPNNHYFNPVESSGSGVVAIPTYDKQYLYVYKYGHLIYKKKTIFNPDSPFFSRIWK